MRPAVVSTVLAIAALAATASPAAASYHRCSIGAQHYHVTYVTRIQVSHVSCSTGRRVVRAYHECARANGVKGRCHRRVLRYRCSEKRSYGVGEFTGVVTCTRGHRRVRHSYSQLT